MNKFIFLDIDGVMNSNLFYSERTQDKRYNDWIKEHPQRIAWNACNIDPRAVERLNRLTDATGAKIVVSSTWRSDSNLQEVFNLVGIKEPIHDITPYMRSRHRGPQIPKKCMGEAIKLVKAKLANVDGKLLADTIKTYLV